MNIVEKRLRERKKREKNIPNQSKQVEYINWKKREKGGGTWIQGIGSGQSGEH